MSEENNQQTQGEKNTVTNNNTQVEKNDTPNEVPYSRFQEKNNQNKSLMSENEKLKMQIEEQRQKDAKAREEQLKKNDQHEVIINELKAENEKLKVSDKEWTDYKSNRRDWLTEQLPEHRREFAEGMPLDKLEKFVESEIKISASVKTDASRPGMEKTGEFNGYSSFAEWAEKDPASYEKQNVITNSQIKIGYGE